MARNFIRSKNTNQSSKSTTKQAPKLPEYLVTSK